MSEIVTLPDNFIGKEDEQRLESFGARLISRGWATRWHWNRERGIDVAFEIFTGGASERLIVSIVRNRERDAFLAKDAAGGFVAEGALERVMAVVDKLASSKGGNRSA